MPSILMHLYLLIVILVGDGKVSSEEVVAAMKERCASWGSKASKAATAAADTVLATLR